MHQLLHFITLFFFLVSQIPTINGAIKSMTISSDSRRIIFLEEFCFDRTGHIALHISNVSITTTSTTLINSSRIGFFLGDDYNILYFPDMVISLEGMTTCILEFPGFKPIATFDELSPDSSLNKTLPITAFRSYNMTLSIPIPDRIGLYFWNCEPNTSVSMNVHLETYNIDKNGKDYLPVGRTQLPTVYFTFSVLYLPFLAFWAFECYKNRHFVRKVHVLMFTLLIIKSLSLFFEAEDKQYIKVTGTPHGWDVWFYLFYCLRALLLVTIIMLIGTGWTIMKPVLHANDKEVLTVGIAIQLFGTIAHICTDELGPPNSLYLFWAIGSLVVDLAGFTIVFVPIFSSIKSLKETAEMDGTAAQNLGKLRLLGYFNGCVLLFWLGKWMARLFVGEIAADYCGLEWLVDTSMETVTFMFYIVIFDLFKPRQQNDYFVVEDEEVALATIQIEFPTDG